MNKTITLILICLICLGFQVKSDAQSIMTSDTVYFKYYAATSEPASNWYQPGFDDSGWPSGSGVVGYGYGASGYTVVGSNTASIYQRITFQVADTSRITQVNLLVDYDDGYIAYLNGHEIARVNIDTTKFPEYNAVAIRSHKSEYVLGLTYPVLGVYLDKSVLRSCLVNGDNVLAIHTLNDTLQGSSLICIPNLINETSIVYNYYNDESRYKRLIKIDSSDIPLVVINTDAYGIPYEGYVNANMGIINNGPGNYNKLDDPFNDYSGPISIKLRGQSSHDFPKTSYHINLLDPNGNDTNLVLLGMPKESDWVLFGPFTDKSQIRNKLVYDLGRKLGEYNPRTRFCELIINGQSVGLYILTENIKRGKDRVNISKLKESDTLGLDVTGGYIFKYDKVGDDLVSLTKSRQVEYPKSLQKQQRAYCEHFFHLYDSVLNWNNFRDPVIGYRKYLSDSSLVDYLIINEITKNADSYLFSTYFYKDREDKDNRIKFGPLWDYDLCFGNTIFQGGNLTNGWQFANGTNTRLTVTRLFQDTALVDFFQQRYAQLRATTLSNDSIFAFIDTLVKYTEKARIRNYEIWPLIDKDLFYPAYSVTSYEGEINTIKDWLTDRLLWIDDNISKISYPVKIYSPIIEAQTGVYSFNAFPNPFNEELKLDLLLQKQQDVRVDVISLTGQIISTISNKLDAGEYEINLMNEKVSSLQSGLYFVRLYLDNIPVGTEKIIKN
jgi:hypothetical protein